MELLDDEKAKYYYGDDISIAGAIAYDTKKDNNKITVDSNGFEHSFNDEPAYIRYSGDNISDKFWYKHAYQHRLTGPAYISFNNLGYNQYWLNGKQFSRYDWETEVNRLNLLQELS